MNLTQNIPRKTPSEIKLRFLSQEEKTLETKEEKLPLVVEPTAENSFLALRHLIGKYQGWFEQQLHHYGAILFRNFQVETAPEFQAILEEFGVALASNYHFGSAMRERLTEKVFTASSGPSEMIISPHNELNFVPVRPKMIAFFCEVEPEQYGETPLINTEKLFYDLPLELQEKFLNLPQQFRRYVPSNLLEMVFEGLTEDEITQMLQEQGFDFSWNEDGSLYFECSYTPLFNHPQTNRICLCLSIFNCLVNREWYGKIRSRYPFLQGLYNRFFPRSWYKLIEQNRSKVTNTFDKSKPKGSIDMKFLSTDGQRIDLTDGEAEELGKAQCRNAVIFRWQQGDVLIVDNQAVAHGRLNKKLPRKVQTAFGNMYNIHNMKSATI